MYRHWHLNYENDNLSDNPMPNRGVGLTLSYSFFE